MNPRPFPRIAGLRLRAGPRAPRRDSGRRRLRALLALALLLSVAASPACKDEPAAPASAPSTPTDPPAPPGGVGVGVGTGVDVEAAKRAAEEDLKAQDERASRLLRRFRERLWDPGRDGLATAAGEVALAVDGKRGVYRFEFDASRKPEEQVALTTASADEGIHSGAFAQAKRFAVLGLLGPYHSALRSLPPTSLRVVGSGDGPGTLVVVPPFKSQLGSSYQLGAGGLIELRGDSDGKEKEIARFTWKDWQGRAVLVRADFGKDAASVGTTASTTYEYEDRDGMPCLVRAALVEGEHRCEATLTYSSWVRR